MPKPTANQLKKINKLALEPRTEDNTFVFRSLAIDDQETAYHSKIHERLLRKMKRDAEKGVALLLNHNNRQLPAGRSFDAELVTESIDEGTESKTLYIDFYIDLGRMTQGGMSTDDIAKGIEAGTLFDVSIGFNANKWICSICGNDIRDYRNCYHIPGRTYEIEGKDGVFRQQKCVVIVGDDGEGELLETSLVYAGACGRAQIKQNFSSGTDVREFLNGTKLELVDDFKNIPLNATIYQFYSNAGLMLFTDTQERTEGSEYLKRRSEEKVELAKVMSYLKETFNITAENEEQLKEQLGKFSELNKEFEATKESLVKVTSELNQTKTELANKVAELESANQALSSKDAVIQELQKKNEELSAKAEVADTYRSDLIKQALTLGVRAQGNAFQSELFEKFLNTLSLDEIKGVIAGFEQEVKSKFEHSRLSEGSDRSLENRVKDDVPDEFENELEFRAYVANKAIEYAKENNVSLKEATKLMYEKYRNKDGSEE